MTWHMQGVIPPAATPQTSHISSRTDPTELGLYPIQNFPKDFLPLALTSQLFGFMMKWIFLKSHCESVSMKLHLISAGGTTKWAVGRLQAFSLKENKPSGTSPATGKEKENVSEAVTLHIAHRHSWGNCQDTWTEVNLQLTTLPPAQVVVCMTDVTGYRTTREEAMTDRAAACDSPFSDRKEFP